MQSPWSVHLTKLGPSAFVFSSFSSFSFFFLFFFFFFLLLPTSFLFSLSFYFSSFSFFFFSFFPLFFFLLTLYGCDFISTQQLLSGG